MIKKVEFLIIILCCCGLSAAQQVVSSGGFGVKTDVSVNWILGGSLSDLPTIDVNALNKILREQLLESEIPVKAYPSPATDFLNVEIPFVDTSRVSLELYNNSGVKVLNRTDAYQPLFRLNISTLPTGIYFLRVFLPSAKAQLFSVEKIIKF